MRFASPRPRRAAALLGLAVAAACFPAGTRAAPPREINSLAKEMSPRISRCLIRREAALIDRWLRLLPGSAEESRLMRTAEPRFPACFGEAHGIMGSAWLPKYDRAGMRSALVRALLQARRDRLPVAPPAATGSPPYGVTADPDDADAAAVVATNLGSCLARKHWGSVRAIILAVDPETERLSFYTSGPKVDAAHRREAAAVDSQLSTIIPSISACVPAGTRLRVNRLRLRSLVEEAAYHMTSRPAAEADARSRADSAS